MSYSWRNSTVMDGQIAKEAQFIVPLFMCRHKLHSDLIPLYVFDSRENNHNDNNSYINIQQI